MPKMPYGSGVSAADILQLAGDLRFQPNGELDLDSLASIAPTLGMSPAEIAQSVSRVDIVNTIDENGVETRREFYSAPTTQTSDQFSPVRWSHDPTGECKCHGGQTYTHGIFMGLHRDELPEPISPEEVKALAAQKRSSIWENYELLKAIVERYETVLQRRWNKKSKVKRRNVLSVAWLSTSHPPPPPMATRHRPDVYDMSNTYDGCLCRHHEPPPQEKRHYYFWPLLNLEDLSMTEPILLLLNARGRHHPSSFAYADLTPAQFGLAAANMTMPRFLGKYNMVFTEDHTAETYGELISWNDDPTASQRLQSGRDVSPGEGIWILEIQQRLYQFLVNMTKEILHDVSFDDKNELLTHPIEPEPPLPTANKGDHGLSLRTARHEMAYHVPAKLDVRRLQQLIASKRDEAADALLALREDPGFFAALVNEGYDNLPEQVPDTKGRPHRILGSKEGRTELKARIVDKVCAYYLPATELWTRLHDVVVSLADLKESLFDKALLPIRSEDDLPRPLAMAFYSVLQHIRFFFNVSVKEFDKRGRLCPHLRHLQRRVPTADGSTKFEMTDADVSPEIVRYVWSFGMLHNPKYRADYGLHNAVEDLERIALDPVSREMITPSIAESLSDMTIISECQRQIDLFQPWSATFAADMAEMADDDTARELRANEAKMRAELEPLVSFKLSRQTRILGAQVAWLKYPVDNRPSKAKVDAMRSAEQALDVFWEAALGELRESAVLPERIGTLLTTKVERTSPWVDCPQKVPTKAATLPPAQCMSSQPFGGVFLADATAMHEDAVLEPKTKVKRRGTARPTLPGNENDDMSQAAPQATLPIFPVDRRALRVFHMLFHRPIAGGSSQSPGEIHWTEFIHAMLRAGFRVQKLGGSAWEFTPLAGVGCAQYTRGIHFHEPHPVSKITYTMARRIGRRLERAYGWDADAFVLAENTA